MPAWTPAPYSLPYIAGNDVLEQTPATNKAQMEKISEYLSQIESAAPPIGGIISWALPWNPSDTPNDYSNVSRFAPEYLPCTGVVYPRTRAPELCDAIGHIYVDGNPDVGDVGDYVSGAALNKHHGSGYENSAIYKRTATGFDLVEADGFCTPDLRGRSPIGQHSLNDAVVGYSTALGQRQGDWRTKSHRHSVIDTGYAAAGPRYLNAGTPDEWSGFSGMSVMASDGVSGPTTPHEVRRINVPSGTNVNPPSDLTRTWMAYDRSEIIPESHAAHGNSHFQPQTVVNFLIACGVSGSATPSTRSGEIHRLHSVTTGHMIRQRLADPNLSDEEREALEEQLASLS